MKKLGKKLTYKAYGEKLQERTATLYKPDQSIHPETCHTDEIKAELDKHFNINANSLHQYEHDGCKCGWRTWTLISCEQVKISMDFLYTKNCSFFWGEYDTQAGIVTAKEEM